MVYINIGIIIYSKTGHTKSVAIRLKEKLTEKGNIVDLIELKPLGDLKSPSAEIKFELIPETEKYDGFVLSSFVEAFSLASVMKAFINKAESFGGKKTALLLTQHFPFKWMGGNGALGYMKKACEKKGAKIAGSAIINWSRKSREMLISESVEELSKLF